TKSGAPAIEPIAPPTIPVISPRSAGTPHATAMPMHRGNATRNTTIDAMRSRNHVGVASRVSAGADMSEDSDGSGMSGEPAAPSCAASFEHRPDIGRRRPKSGRESTKGGLPWVHREGNPPPLWGRLRASPRGVGGKVLGWASAEAARGRFDPGIYPSHTGAR